MNILFSDIAGICVTNLLNENDTRNQNVIKIKTKNNLEVLINIKINNEISSNCPISSTVARSKFSEIKKRLDGSLGKPIKFPILSLENEEQIISQCVEKYETIPRSKLFDQNETIYKEIVRDLAIEYGLSMQEAVNVLNDRIPIPKTKEEQKRERERVYNLQNPKKKLFGR